jgi:hypothetical protein
MFLCSVNIIVSGARSFGRTEATAESRSTVAGEASNWLSVLIESGHCLKRRPL